MIPVAISDRNGERASFSAAQGQRLLQAGLAVGLGLPHECASGTCGNCKATLLSGDVRRLWPQAPGARVCRDPAEFLLCQTAADGPVEFALRSLFIAPYAHAPAEMGGTISCTRALTPEIATFRVTLDQPMPYSPGQFVLLSGLGVDGPRAYSMTQHEPGAMHLDLLIRKDASGAFTQALFDNLAASHEVRVFGPLGRATFACDEDRPFIAMAGGSGIAGILSILHHAEAADHFAKHSSHVFFGLRDSASSYLLEELSAAVARSQGKLAVTIAFSTAPCGEEFAGAYPFLNFTDGFVHDVVRARLLDDGAAGLRAAQKPVWFVAGPPVMVNATMRVLITEGKISPMEIRYDRFG